MGNCLAFYRAWRNRINPVDIADAESQLRTTTGLIAALERSMEGREPTLAEKAQLQDLHMARTVIEAGLMKTLRLNHIKMERQMSTVSRLLPAMVASDEDGEDVVDGVDRESLRDLVATLRADAIVREERIAQQLQHSEIPSARKAAAASVSAAVVDDDLDGLPSVPVERARVLVEL